MQNVKRERFDDEPPTRLINDARAFDVADTPLPVPCRYLGVFDVDERGERDLARAVRKRLRRASQPRPLPKTKGGAIDFAAARARLQQREERS
jgi:hypothetical protein